METIHLKIKRQDNPDGLSYWEEFRVACEPDTNVIAALMAIRDDPVTAEGLPTTPVAWEQNCLEEVCGSCTMVINGKVRQACNALVDHLDQPIVLEPLGTFPVVRDLKIDRSSMFASLDKVMAWSDLDGLHDQPASFVQTAEEQRALLELSSCIACGACLEACPQVNDRSPYLGAFVVGQVLLMNRRYLGAKYAGIRLDAMRGPGGLGGCSNAGACAVVCPKGIPLHHAIARLQWDVAKHSLMKFFSFNP